MFQNSQDLLNISLSFGFLLIAIFLVITLFYTIFILRDLAEISRKIRRTTNQLSTVVIEPLKFLTQIFAKGRSGLKIIEEFLAPQEKTKAKKDRRK